MFFFKNYILKITQINPRHNSNIDHLLFQLIASSYWRLFYYKNNSINDIIEVEI